LREQNTKVFEQLTWDEKFNLHVRTSKTIYSTKHMVVALDQCFGWCKEARDTTSTVKGGHTSWHSLKRDKTRTMSNLLLLFKWKLVFKSQKLLNFASFYQSWYGKNDLANGRHVLRPIKFLKFGDLNYTILESYI
jgi:hypothetical protein